MSSGPIEEAVAAAMEGRLIVLPTDTVYGIGARPDSREATDRLFEAKGRGHDLQLPVLIASSEAAEQVAHLDERARRLSGAWWPGPLTLVLPRTALSLSWHLGGDPSTIGIRIPRHPLARAVLSSAGPLAVSSANRSGDPPAVTCDELMDTFGDAVAIYLCQDEPVAGAASTVVDLTKDEPAVLREGEVSADDIMALLSGEEPLLDSPLSP